MQFRDPDEPEDETSEEEAPRTMPYDAMLQDIHPDIRPVVALLLVITEDAEAAASDEEKLQREEDHAGNSAWVEAAKRIKFGHKGALMIDLVEPFAYKGDPKKDRITFRAITGRDFVSGAFNASDFVLGDALSDGLVSKITCDEDMCAVLLGVKIQRGKFNTPRRMRGS